MISPWRYAILYAKYPERADTAMSKADIFILLGVVISFSLGVYLFFTGNHDQGIFVATWVPAILAFGIYFKLLRRTR